MLGYFGAAGVAAAATATLMETPGVRKEGSYQLGEVYTRSVSVLMCCDVNSNKQSKDTHRCHVTREDETSGTAGFRRTSGATRADGPEIGRVPASWTSHLNTGAYYMRQR